MKKLLTTASIIATLAIMNVAQANSTYVVTDKISSQEALSIKMDNFVKNAINAKQKDFKKIDADFEKFSNTDKIKLLNKISLVLSPLADTKSNNDNLNTILDLTKEASRVFNGKFIGDLNDDELSFIISSRQTNKLLNGNSPESGCLYVTYNQTLTMYDNYVSYGYLSDGFRRTVNTSGEYPCDYEVSFYKQDPTRIGTNSWVIYKLLQIFNGKILHNNGNALFGFWRTSLWLATTSELVVKNLLTRYLLVK